MPFGTATTETSHVGTAEPTNNNNSNSNRSNKLSIISSLAQQPKIQMTIPILPTGNISKFVDKQQDKEQSQSTTDDHQLENQTKEKEKQQLMNLQNTKLGLRISMDKINGCDNAADDEVANVHSFKQIHAIPINGIQSDNDSKLFGSPSQSLFVYSADSTVCESYSKRLLSIKSPRYGSDFKITEEGIKIKGMSVLEYRKFCQPESINTDTVASSATSPSVNFSLNFNVYSVDEFHKFPMKELGNGSFGSVYRVAITNPKTNDKLFFAEKRVTDTAQKQLDLIFKEVKTIFECDSPYLVKLHECFYKECTYYMIMDFMSLGSLHKMYTNYKKYLAQVEKKSYSIPESVISVIISKTLKGLIYLHVKKHIIHRDLKPANILIDDKGYVKISDFGLVGIKEGNEFTKKKNHDTALTIWDTFTGSVTYMSPERLNNESYSYNSDIWSIGIITVELFLGHHPLSNENFFSLGSMTREEIHEQCIKKIKNAGASEDLCSFIDTCLLKYKDLGERPDINGIILKHPFIKNHEQFQFRNWIKNEYISKLYQKSSQTKN